ncbi:OmpA family protein [Vibrio nomapromontoriensis]|uniref:OmpA family protein n=1 Tax=Vibrio nomapromontoriensis TaxID=2910246 RepID=UPI003D1493A9
MRLTKTFGYIGVLSVTFYASSSIANEKVVCHSESDGIWHTTAIKQVVVQKTKYNHQLVSRAEFTNEEVEELIASLSEDGAISRLCIQRYQLSEALKIEPVQDNQLLGSVFFDFDSETLSSAEKIRLKELASTLIRSDRYVLLEGNTDSVGTDHYNLSLGLKRTETVSKLLASSGVTNSVKQVSKGESEPIADNTAVESRALNRRVDVYAID